MPMFALNAKPVYALDDAQDEYVSGLFLKMTEEINSDYAFKYDLIRNYVTELAYYALKTHPSENVYKHADAKSRITSVFTAGSSAFLKEINWKKMRERSL